MHWVLGIDIGTTATKALLLDVDSGAYHTSTSQEYPLYSDFPGWAEADPRDWVRGMNEALSQLRKERPEAFGAVKALAVCGMVPAVVLLDRHYHVLRRSIQQNDARTSKELDAIKGGIKGMDLFGLTGSVLNQQHVIPKLLWIRRHEPAVWRETAHVIGSYDYIRGLLTDHYTVEANWAVESGCFDVRSNQWLTAYLDTFQIPLAWLGEVNDPLALGGPLLKRVALEWGLKPGIPVIVGSADHVASALAAGVEEDGDLLIKFGGAGDILYCTSQPTFHPQLYFDRHDLPGKYLLNGCMASSGSLVRWMLERLKASETMLPALDRQAANIPSGSDGVLVLPYFLGEKTPLFNPAARGAIFGLMLHHTDAHLFRATLESVIYGFRHHFEVLETAGYPINRVFATNGGAKSSLWRQIAADCLGRPVMAFPEHPGSAMGAAIVAAMGANLFPDRAVLDVITANGVRHDPISANTVIYDKGYYRYRELYERTKDLM